MSLSISVDPSCFGNKGISIPDPNAYNSYIQDRSMALHECHNIVPTFQIICDRVRQLFIQEEIFYSATTKRVSTSSMAKAVAQPLTQALKEGSTLLNRISYLYSNAVSLLQQAIQQQEKSPWHQLDLSLICIEWIAFYVTIKKDEDKIHTDITMWKKDIAPLLGSSK